MVTTRDPHDACATGAGALCCNAAPPPSIGAIANMALRADTSDRWSREARRVRRLAAARGLALNDTDLVHYDMRDLLSLGLRLREQQGVLPASSGLRQRSASFPHASLVAGDPERMLANGPYISTRQSGLSFSGFSLSGALAVLFAALLPLAAPLIALALLVALTR